MKNRLKSQLIEYAASLTNNHNLKPLIDICYSQKTISTNRLLGMLKEINNKQISESIFLKKVYDSMVNNKE